MLKGRIPALLLALSLSACGKAAPALNTPAQATKGDALAVAGELVKGLDRNGDRLLSAEEADLVFEADEFKQADANRDGNVTAAEAAAFLSRAGSKAASSVAGQSVGQAVLNSQAVSGQSLGGIAIGIGLGVGAIAAGYLTYAGLKGAGDVMWPKLNQSTTRPQDLGMVAEDVAFDSDVAGLRGWYIPAPNPTRKCLIFQHGHGGNKSQFLAEYVPWLRKTGYNILTFDFRGCGESPKVACSLGYFEAKEVTSAIAFAKSRGNDDIGLMGFSMGAASMLIAGGQDASVRGIVEDCSFSDWYHAFHPRIVNKKYPLPGPVALAIQKTLELKLGINGDGAQPIKYVSKWAGRPLLIIHGDSDKSTTPDNAQQLYYSAAEPKAMWMVPGAGHADSHKVAPLEYEQRVLDFWSRTM
jgi:fermentation-respiration switch protein FrsA (DUF1100 family)